MEARAISRHVRISPRKARLVADLVRGKTVEQALQILALTPRKASPLLRKAIASAAANARFQADEDTEISDAFLVVTEICVDPGPTMKRIRPRAQGRAYRVLRRSSHIRVTVATDTR